MTGFTPKVRNLIRERSSGICEVQANLDNILKVVELDERWRRLFGKFCGCQGGEAVHQHHRRNRGSGGSRRADTNLASNGLHACLKCHELIGRYPWVGYSTGWLVRQGQSPLGEKALRRGVWVMLGDDGSVTPLPSTGAWGETPGLGEGLDDDWPLGQVTF